MNKITNFIKKKLYISKTKRAIKNDPIFNPLIDNKKITLAIEIIQRYTPEEYKKAGDESEKNNGMRWGACGCSMCVLRTLGEIFGDRTKPEDGIIFG